MKTFIVEKYARSGAVTPSEQPDPQVADDEVLVHVEAAGVNPLDSKIASGEFKLIVPHKPPFILGHDVAGVVVRVGPGVTTFAPSDAVYARPGDARMGTFAELTAIKEIDLALMPANISYAEAASLPLVALTAWQALVDRAQVAPGQKVLIHAGSGGFGTIAIQLAKHLGAEVAATTSSANVDLVRSLGADVVVDYRSEDFANILSGYDVVIDSLGADNVVKSLKVLRPGGVVIGIGGPPDPAFTTSIGANPVVTLASRLLSRRVRRTAKRLGVKYSFLFMQASGRQLAQITPLIENGTIRPVIDRVFPFDETLDAISYVDTGRARGKVVVSMS